MPLRDHFRSPVNDQHSWDELHGGWPMKIVEALAPRLPADYRAAPQVHLGGAVEIDVGTHYRNGAKGSATTRLGGGGSATALWTESEPTLRIETELPDVDEYEVLVYDVARGRRLVAAIELVSPSNKNRPETRRAFVAKCAALLQKQVSVTIVDVVTIRDFNLYAELLEFLGENDHSVAEPPSNIYAVACRGTIPRDRWLLEAWHRPLHVGQKLPEVPIWLSEKLAVTLDLESSYEETCRVLRIS